MKGKLAAKAPKEWTNPEGQIKKFFEVEIEGIAKKYGCWQYTELAAKNIGDEIEFEESEKGGRWSMKLAGTASKGGGFAPKGKSPEELKQQVRSFAASYSKDIAVALINQSKLPTSKEIDATLQHYYLYFKGILEAV